MRHFFLTVLLAAISIATAAEPLAIKTVKTWKELSEQTPIALKDGSTVRFGIEALSAPLNAGVVLYCMTDRVQVEALRNTLAEECIGPFRMKVEQPGQQKLESRIQSQQAQSRINELVAQGRALYVQLIPVADKAGCRVSVLNKANELLAKVEISAEGSSQPWVGFADDRNTEVVKVEFEDKRRHGPEQNVIAGAGGIRLPNFDGTEPLLYVLADGQRGDNDFKDDQSLPGLLQFAGDTFKPDPSKKPPVTISYDAPRLDITTPIAFERTFFNDKFIARWRLNGKPVENFPKLGAIARNFSGKVSYHKEARLNLRFVPEAIGAKKGDKVAVQLLYCPHGSRGIGTYSLMEMLAKEMEMSAKEYRLRFPMLSNVVEFEME